MKEAGDAPALEMRRVVKRYHALRPLRVASLVIRAGERVSIGGVDAPAGEVLVNLVTGATLPDEGEVRVFGQATGEIASGDAWLASLDRFGIVSERAVLLEGSTLQQNLALPFTLDIDPIPVQITDQVRSLAHRCGIDPDRWLSVQAGALPVEIRIRSHLARAVALEPGILIVEHPTAALAPGSVQALGADIDQALEGMGAAMLVLTDDDRFARAVASRNLKLHAATGELKPIGRRWLAG
jgi:ABC-type transporter Mla maintaining outer membrane lipid asymmetry ATPase subunit MlaF